MEKITCKGCQATVDEALEFCSSCGEWLGLKLEEPIDTTAAATEETTVNNSDGVVLVKIPANAIPQEILERPGLKIDV